MQSPRIKIWDLETGFNILAAFSLFNKYAPIPHKNVLQERYIICGSFKNLGDKEIRTYSVTDKPRRFKKNPVDDYYVVKALREELLDSDAIIAHNGDHFDVKYFNTRCLFHGLGPVPKLIQIDTYKVAKKLFNFNSNRLDYLASFLGVGKKMSIGHEVWLDALRGDAQAVQKIAKYNVVDVKVLEKVYTKMAPYDTSPLNMSLYNGGDLVCPLCGSAHITGEGWRTTRTRRYQRLKCNECGHWFQSTKSDPYTAARTK